MKSFKLFWSKAWGSEKLLYAIIVLLFLGVAFDFHSMDTKNSLFDKVWVLTLSVHSLLYIIFYRINKQ